MRSVNYYGRIEEIHRYKGSSFSTIYLSPLDGTISEARAVPYFGEIPKELLGKRAKVTSRIDGEFLRQEVISNNTKLETRLPMHLFRNVARGRETITIPFEDLRVSKN